LIFVIYLSTDYVNWK